MKDVVMVLTSKSLKTMLNEGGSGDWKAREERIRRCKWLVAVRNRHTDWSQGHEEHGTAFLIARIAGARPSSKGGRLIIGFDQYASVAIPDAWPPGFRNPIRYAALRDLEIDLGALKWKDISRDSGAKPERPNERKQRHELPSTVIKDAKLKLADVIGVAPSQVRITFEI